MSEEKFDAIVVGGGLAGLTCAYLLAQAEMEVLLIERGDFCGAKNVTGGRLYAHTLEKVIPGFAEEAPVERKVTKERIALMTEKGAVNIEYASGKEDDAASASYTVLRGKFDKWFADKAEEVGVMMVPGIRVDEVLVEDGKVVGIDAGGEAMYADIVVLADGVNSLLAQQLGRDVATDGHHGRAVRHRGRDTGRQVRGTGTGRRKAHANAPRGARVAVRGVSGTLLVAHKIVVDAARLVQSVVYVQDRAAGIPKDGVHPLLLEAFQQNLSPCQLQFHRSPFPCCPVASLPRALSDV